MAVGKDDAEITDAYVALTAAGGPETVIPTATPFFVVVKAEAGTNAILNGVPYTIRVVLQNITAFTNLVNAPQSGFLAIAAAPAVPPFSTVPAWTTANTDVTFVITVPGVSGPSGTIYKIIAIAFLGAAQKNVNTFESELIVVD